LAVDLSGAYGDMIEHSTGCHWRYARGPLACLLLALMPMSTVVAQDDQSIRELLGTRVACSITEQLLADMPVNPLYARSDGSCTAVDPRRIEGELFSDSACTQPVAFQSLAMQDYCDMAVDGDNLGSAANIDMPVWTLSPGSQIDVGARTLDGVQQPYLQRVMYREVNSSRGNCQLEMRVYAQHPSVTDQRSLLALHGGSWSSRAFGFFGLELTIPHLVERGFVVYAPFYRLLGDTDGIDACNNSTIDDIVSDALASLDWVMDNDTRYGSGGVPVVFGQSAGGHLATAVTVERPESIAGTVLFYPPTDFTDFVLREQAGLYDNPAGSDILELLLGMPASDVDISAAPLPDNTFPERVSADVQIYPPIFMLHGMADELVEARQSSRLCDALAGRQLPAIDEPITPVEALRDIRSCEADESSPRAAVASVMHLIREGRHALDICLESAVLPTQLCLSGSEASRELVSDSIEDAIEFAVAVARADGMDTDDNTGVSGDLGGSSDNSDVQNDDTSDVPLGNDSGSGSGALSRLLLSLLAIFGLWQMMMKMASSRHHGRIN